MNKNNIKALFGKQAGDKLINWLDPCCNGFCEAVQACAGGLNLPIITTFGSGNESQYNQSANLFGIGIKGTSDVYTDTNYNSILGNLFGDFSLVGGTPYSYIAGYLPLGGPGSQVNLKMNYDSGTDAAEASLIASSGLGSAEIEVKSNGGLITFKYGPGTEYLFPNTNPAVGEVLGYVGPNTLGWVANGGSSGITIGDPVTGGSGDSILFVDGSGNLAEDVNNFVYRPGDFFIFQDGTGRYLNVSPFSGEYGIGDIDAIANKNYLVISDSTGTITTGTSQLWQVIDGNTSTQWVKVDCAASVVSIGDVGSLINKTRIDVDDSSKTIHCWVDGIFSVPDTTGNEWIRIDTTAKSVRLGDTSASTNSTTIAIDDTAEQISVITDNSFIIQNPSSDRCFLANTGSTPSIQIGDISMTGNNTRLTVNDSNQTVTVTKPIVLQGYAVIGLPTGVLGMRAYVTDALAPAYGAVVVGGGAITVPVFYDGANWITA